MEKSQLIHNFISGLNIEGGTQKEQIVKLSHAVAQIPWGEARTVEDVMTKGCGTCTGKHLVLQACFDALEIPYKPVVVTFKWGEQGIQFPENLQRILSEGEWDHGHNFVQVEIDNKPIDIDITWDPPLAKYGFKALPLEWNGQSSFIGVKYIKRWDNTNIATLKKELIEGLSPELRERREQFLSGFIQWIPSLRG